jgi:hypothetical protein
MGEMVMNKYFNKDSFICSSCDKKQKLQSLVISLVLIVLFIFASFTFFNAVYAITDSLGAVVSGSIDVAIKEITRSFPIVMSMFMSIWGVLLAHGLFRNVNEERRNKSIKKNAITLLVFAGVNLLFIIIGLAIGKFRSLVEGSPSPLYPLDSILFSLVYVALGIFGLVYLKKLQDKIPYVVPSRGPIVTKARGLYCTFMSFWLLVVLFSFSCFWLGLFIYDFRHEYFFYGFAFLLVCFVNVVFLGSWEFYYNELKEENKKAFLLPIAIAALICSAISIVLYMVGLGTNMDAPSNGGFGILPVAFAASVNIATLIIVFTPLIVSVVALIKALVYRKKANKE